MSVSPGSARGPEEHDLVWTPERIERFWDQAAPEDYFSAQVGPSLASWIRRNARLSDPIVDIGCGQGHLLAEFATRDVLGIEVSGENLRVASKRLRGRVREGTATETGLAEMSAGTVLLVETIEHLLDPIPALVELLRILRPGGALIVSTPNAENLERNKLTCPECGARFHKMQHLRSWTPPQLVDVLRQAGFGEVRTATVQLAPGRGPMRWYRTVRLNLAPERQHLLAVAYRPAEMPAEHREHGPIEATRHYRGG